MHVAPSAPIARSSPSEISDEAKQFDCGQSSFHQCGNLVAIAWKDNTVVNVVSILSLASPTDTTSVNR